MNPEAHALNMDEQAFLAAYDPDRYPRPSVAVDVVLLTVAEGTLWTLVGRRDGHPAMGRWALPGGFIAIDESLDAAAARVLREKAGLEGVFIEQLYTFGDPARDPRTRVIAVAYYALVAPDLLRRATTLNDRVRLARLDVPLTGSPITDPATDADPVVNVLDDAGNPLPMAFDHRAVVGMAVRRIRGKLDYAPLGFELLPDQFTLRELRLVHEAILGRPLNKDSFRRRIIERGLVTPTGERARGVGHRPPERYRFAAAESRG